MVFWRIEFKDGSQGYQVLDNALLLLGLFTDKGDPADNCGDYRTIDSGATDPKIGVLDRLPAWRNKIVDREVP